MPYLTKESAKLKRSLIRKAFPDYKFSITNRHLSVLSVKILAGPMELITDDHDGDRYTQVNNFHIKSNYKNFPKICEVLSGIYDIMRNGNYTESVDGDYGSIPSFYTHLSVGDWDKPYIVTTKK